MISEKHLHYPRNISTGCMQIPAALVIITQWLDTRKKNPLILEVWALQFLPEDNTMSNPSGADMEDTAQSRQSGIPEVTLSHNSDQGCDQGLC